SGFVEGTFASQICDGRISAVSLLLWLRDVNYIAGLSVEVTALQCGPEGISPKRSNNGRFRATMWPPAADDTGVQFTANLWRGSAFSPEDSAWLARSSRGHELTHLQKQVLLKARDGEHW